MRLVFSTGLDTIAELEKPKLGPYKMKIRRKISAILGMPPEAVSVKAKTAEGLGPVGEGLAVKCQAVVTMERIV